MREHGKRSSTAVLVIALGSGFVGASARAGEQFLSLPFTSAYTPYISCRWTCLRDDGSVYRHHATDYGRTRDTTSIVAAADGVVSWMHDGLSPGRLIDDYPYGNHVRIRHSNGYETWYAHLLRGTIVVHEGADVVAGQLLGTSDNSGASSGPHLHFEVRNPRGERVNPYGDPSNYTTGCGTNALWMTCPPTPAPPPDADGDGFTVAQGDCDDSNRDVHPGGIESCNGRDDDCNGTPDDPWRTGLTIDLDQPCTVGIGGCASTGVWVCAPNGATVVCGAEPLPPRAEACNDLDDDCDDVADEDWRVGLETDLGQPCSITWDACRGSTDGSWRCAPDGRAVVCDAPTPGGAPAQPETFNGTDDDCDGVVDNIPIRTIADYSTEVNTFLSDPSVAGDDVHQRFGLSWIEVRQPPPGAEQVRTLHTIVLDYDGNPIGSTQALSTTSYGSTFGQVIVWNGEHYGVAWSVNGGIGFSRDLLFARLDSDGVPYAEPTEVGDPFIVYGVPNPYIGHMLRLVATSDGWRSADGGPVTRQDAYDNLYGNILLRRFSGEGVMLGDVVPVNEAVTRQIQTATFGLASVGGREIIVWAPYGDMEILGEMWEGSSRARRETILTPEPYRSVSRPSLSCMTDTRCWIAWFGGGVFMDGVVTLGTFDVETFAVAPVVSLPPLGVFSDYDFSCTTTDCTFVVTIRRPPGDGYDHHMVVASDSGVAPSVVGTINGPMFAPSEAAVQRLGDRSIMVSSGAGTLVRTIVRH